MKINIAVIAKIGNAYEVRLGVDTPQGQNWNATIKTANKQDLINAIFQHVEEAND